MPVPVASPAQPTSPLPEALGNPVIVATSRRSGTHLTLDLIRHQFHAFRQRLRPLEPFDLLYLSIDRFVDGHVNPISPEEARGRFLRAPRICLKTHLLPGLPGCRPALAPLLAEIEARSQAVYIVRDLREVLVSDAMLALAEARAGQRSSTRAVAGELPDFDAYAREDEDGLPRPAAWARHVRSWSARPRTLVLRFDDLNHDPGGCLERLGDHLGEPPLLREPLVPSPITGLFGHAWRRLIGDGRATTIHGRPWGATRPPRWQDALRPETLRFIDEHAGAVLDEHGFTG